MWNGKAVDEAVRAGVRDALDRHRREGRQIVVWRDGKIVWIDPPAEASE